MLDINQTLRKVSEFSGPVTENTATDPGTHGSIASRKDVPQCTKALALPVKAFLCSHG